MTEPITCPCGREVFFSKDPFHPWPTGETWRGRCKCGRIWELQETSGKEFDNIQETN